VRLGASVAVVVIVAIISIGALVIVTQSGQKTTQSQSSAEQPSSSTSQLLPGQTSSHGAAPVNMTAETSTGCQTGIAVYMGYSNQPGYESTEVSCSTTTTESFGNMTLRLSHDTCYSLPENYYENSSITTRIFGSYYHTLVYLNYNGSFPTHMSAVYNVTGGQIVQGNWTDGYRVTFTNNEIVNVSATLTAPSTYTVTHVAEYPLPDRTYTETYTSQEQQDILAALSNSSVRSDMAGTQYYVYGVSLHNTATTIQVDFFQVNGPNSMAVNLDTATLKAVQIFPPSKWGYIGPFNPQFNC
jgi:hypothetical protein